MMKMLPRLRLLTILLALLPLLAPASSHNPRLPIPHEIKMQTLDRIVAVVNHEVITESQLNVAIAGIKQRFKKTGEPLPKASELRHQVLNQLIYRSLQLQVAKRSKVTLNNGELEQGIGRIAKRNKLTIAQLRQALRQQGVAYSKFRQRIRKEAIIAKLQEAAISPEIKISKAEIQQFMKNYRTHSSARTEYHLLDILIPLPGTPTTAEVQKAERKTQQILRRLRKGANFQKIAMAESAGQQALNGGNLGWRTLAAMPTLFASHIKGATKGKVIGPVRAPNGFHILKIAGMRNPGNGKITEAQAHEILYQRKFQEKLQGWLQQLWNTAYIKIMS